MKGVCDHMHRMQTPCVSQGCMGVRDGKIWPISHWSQPLVSPDALAPPEGAPEDRKQVGKFMT